MVLQKMRYGSINPAYVQVVEDLGTVVMESRVFWWGTRASSRSEVAFFLFLSIPRVFVMSIQPILLGQTSVPANILRMIERHVCVIRVCCMRYDLMSEGILISVT